MKRELSDKAIDFINPSFAPSMVENYLQNILEDVKKQNNGEPLDENKVKEQYKSIAERNIKWYAIRKEIINAQLMRGRKAWEVDDEILRLIERTPKSDKEIKDFTKSLVIEKELRTILLKKR